MVSIERTQEMSTLTHAGASCRHLVIASRMAPGHHLSEFGRNHLQHVFTARFPQAIHGDLTAETVRVDVIVRDSSIIGKVYTAAFLKGDGSVIKTIDYAEGRLMNAKCPSYDQQRSGYYGIKDGADFHLVTYNA